MTKITLLDGGMGQELVHRAGDKPTPLWSTQIMLDHPGLVAQVHADYAAAGATVATMNTYAIHRDRLVNAGIEDQFAALHACAIKEVAGVGTRVAGAIGPLIASYRPDLHPDVATATPLYREVVDILTPHADLIIAETVSSVAQAEAMIAAMAHTDTPLWVAFTVDDEDGTKLRSGEDLSAGLAVCEGVAAVLANCAAPEAIDAAMPILAGAGLPFGGYANAFTMITKAFLQANPTVDALVGRRDMGPDVYAQHALGWIGEGATIVGGCCEVGPAHIATLAEAIRAAGHEVV